MRQKFASKWSRGPFRGGSNPLAAYAVGGINPSIVFDPTRGFYWANGGPVDLADLMQWTGVTITEAGALVPAGVYPTKYLWVKSTAVAGLDMSAGISFTAKGYITYADNDSTSQVAFYYMGSGETLNGNLRTHSTHTGQFYTSHTNGTGVPLSVPDELSFGTDVQFSIASQHYPTGRRWAMNGSVGAEGSATAMPVFTKTPNIQLGDFNASYTGQTITYTEFCVFEGAPWDAGGLAEASAPFDSTGWVAPELAYILAYGDSLTQSGYTPYLHPLRPEYIDLNRGRGSTGTRHTAAYMGAISVTMAVSGDSIVSGANSVTHINGYAIAGGIGGVGDGSDNQFLSRADANDTISVTGTLNGVHGTLTRTATGGPPSTTETYTFTPDAGETLPVATPAGSTWTTDPVFVNGATALGQSNVLCVWVGSNDCGFGQITDRFDPHFAAIATFLAGERVIYMGAINRTGDAQTNWHEGGLIYDEVIHTNTVIEAAVGSAYFDVRSFLVNDGLAYAGLTATAQDLIDIGRDTPPTSLKLDFIHNNADGNTAIARKINEIILAKGWA